MLPRVRFLILLYATFNLVFSCSYANNFYYYSCCNLYCFYFLCFLSKCVLRSGFFKSLTTSCFSYRSNPYSLLLWVGFYFWGYSSFSHPIYFLKVSFILNFILFVSAILFLPCFDFTLVDSSCFYSLVFLLYIWKFATSYLARLVLFVNAFVFIFYFYYFLFWDLFCS